MMLEAVSVLAMSARRVIYAAGDSRGCRLDAIPLIWGIYH
jgi:hypothetical protein